VKDDLRLKALKYSLQSDYLENNKQLADVQAELKMLLHSDVKHFILPEINISMVANDSLPAMADLINMAMENRPDYKVAKVNFVAANHNLALQKSTAVPELTVGLEYDKQSNFNPNYYGLALGLPIPIVDHNQGNIKAAKIGISQQQLVVDATDEKLRSEVFNALNKLYMARDLMTPTRAEFNVSYDDLFSNMVKSYKQRQIGLLEFIDYFDAYKDVKLKSIQQNYNYLKAKEELNYVVGQDILKN
jgi:cobalt-zinc-cadmium efflux system outer membrane protein